MRNLIILKCAGEKNVNDACGLKTIYLNSVVHVGLLPFVHLP